MLKVICNADFSMMQQWHTWLSLTPPPPPPPRCIKVLHWSYISTSPAGASSVVLLYIEQSTPPPNPQYYKIDNKWTFFNLLDAFGLLTFNSKHLSCQCYICVGKEFCFTQIQQPKERLLALFQDIMGLQISEIFNIVTKACSVMRVVIFPTDV